MDAVLGKLRTHTPFGKRLRIGVKSPLSLLLRLLVYLSAGTTFLALLFIIGYILVKGVPYLSLDLFNPVYTSENVSLFPALINTLWMTGLALIPAVPIGIFSAIYIVEYAKKGNRFMEVVRLTSETLSGIPSIVYGLFGYLFFGAFLGLKYSMLSGALTLSVIILPLIMRTTEEALLTVPDSFREGSFALGAGKLRTIGTIILPSAMNGILSGVILGVGRIVGETAALIYTAGTVANIPKNILSSGRTLAVHMYVLSSEGFNMNECYATAVVLIVLAILINTLSSFVAKRFGTVK